MNAMLLWATLGTLAQAPEAPGHTPRCVVLPVTTPENAPTHVKDAASGLETALGVALARQGGVQVMTRGELMALVDEAQRAQLLGCDAQSCLTELADALGAEMILKATLDLQAGLWNFQAVMLDRKTAQALRRAGMRARSLQQLVGSLDELARQLSTGTNVSTRDPRLQNRLATNEAGVALLKDELAKNPDADLISTWTRIVIQHNRESGALALAQGAALLVGGVALGLGGVVFAGFAAAHTLATYSRWGTENDPVRNYPWLTAVLYVLSPLPVALVALGAAGVVLALAAVDLLDRGKIPVARRGCCRDEREIQAANKSDWMRQVAPYLAAVGACGALLLPLPSQLAILLYGPIAFLGITFPPSLFGPSVDLDRVAYERVDSTVNSVAFFGVLFLTIPFAALALAGTAVLMGTNRNSVVDGE